MALMQFLDRTHSIARPGYHRWLVPPAALAIHLCIGQVYALSVFNLPMTKLIGHTDTSLSNWSLPALGWTFSIALAVLGLSAALFGTWVEAVGPRKAMFTSACCFGAGFQVAAIGVHLHELWLVYLGYGLLGGIGLGLGYIAPVSTLMKWFPDRPGMATGMAIMGFGGGAMIGSPLSVMLMDHFRSLSAQGVAPTFVSMGLIYIAFMMLGVFSVRLPPPDWKPAGYRSLVKARALITTADVAVAQSWRTRQFWLLWAVLWLNVTAGIGVLGQASPMIQEMFPGRISVAAAAGFVGLLSLFNLVGRFFWSTISDLIGRKMTYVIYFSLGALLYALVPSMGRLGNVSLFVGGFGIILSMYGGGFSTIPAYLKDLFGTYQVGAIHGRLLTAWSAAAICGPVLVNYIREYQIHHGVANAEGYSVTMYIMASLLAVGFLCNISIRAVDSRHHVQVNVPSMPVTSGTAHMQVPPTSAPPLSMMTLMLLMLSWISIGIPLAFGIYQTIKKASALFT